MIKRKATVLGIILIAAGGWVALVRLVLTDNFLTGAALSVAGGIVIGVAVSAFLLRWWFKGIEGRR